MTLDEDVVEGLKALARKRNLTFKEALNSMVRAGLTATPSSRRPFVQETFPMGPAKFDMTKASQLAADLEDEENIRGWRWC